MLMEYLLPMSLNLSSRIMIVPNSATMVCNASSLSTCVHDRANLSYCSLGSCPLTIGLNFTSCKQSQHSGLGELAPEPNLQICMLRGRRTY
jgi:hypothetical protein